MKNNKATTRQIRQGLNGRGHAVYVVQTTTAENKVYQETFDTREEAEHWVKWA